MKNIISVLLMASFLMMSCKKDFLDILPESSLTIDKLFNTDKDFMDAIIGAYSEFQDFYDYYHQLGDLPGDDYMCETNYATSQINIDNFAIDVNAGIVNDAWRDLYQVIERTNLLLLKEEDVDASIVANRDVYIGEAKFLRALAYFNLARIFGDLPMITASVTIVDALETPRTDVDIIYDEVIIKDLLDAETKLPATYSAANVGRATKGAAKSLLGLVYLTRKDFVKAESKLQEVTTMGYALLDDFEDLFDFNNEHHSEYIFDIEYIDGNVGLGSYFTRDFLFEPQTVGAPLANAMREVYNINEARSGGLGSPSAELIALFDPLDLRKDRTVATGMFDLQGNWVGIIGDQISSFSKKYMTSYSIDGKANWRVIRYADVLLMLAEALNENGKTAEALVQLNKIRTRAGVPNYSNLTQSETRDKIYLERRFELYLEGHRWFDLVRTGRALSVMAPYGMKSHMTIFPVPQTQIEVVNDPEIFWQNDGY